MVDFHTLCMYFSFEPEINFCYRKRELFYLHCARKWSLRIEERENWRGVGNQPKNASFHFWSLESAINEKGNLISSVSSISKAGEIKPGMSNQSNFSWFFTHTYTLISNFIRFANFGSCDWLHFNFFCIADFFISTILGL